MPRLTLALLGSAFAADSTGNIVEFKTAKNLALLAYLALESRHPHRREALAGLFWPDFDNTAARNSLRQALATLRLALGDREAEVPLILATRETVQFNSASDYTLDAQQFAAHWHHARTHRHRRLETCPTCAAPLADAVALYGGDLLAGLSLGDAPVFEQWLTARREAYHQQALQALHILAAGALRQGSYDEALAFARRELELEPWNETAHRQAMRALAYGAQRAAALAQFARAEQVLLEELGVPPGEETRQLYARIRDETLGPSPFDRRLRETIPMAQQPLVGREAEVQALRDMVLDPDARLITLIGPGGIGKTRLAQAVGRSIDAAFPHGVAYVSLAGATDATALTAAITDTVGLRLNSGIAERDQLLAFLREKELLLILDNYEQLLPETEVLQAVLREAPGVVLVVTSRERLGLRDEWLFQVDYLSVPAPGSAGDTAVFSGIQLFLQRARRADRHFTLTPENRDAVAFICRLAGGLPLAIELAAAQVRYYAPEYIAGRLQQSQDLLATRERGLDPRHRSIAAAFEYSWQLLTPEEQACFMQLSVFRGGFALESAAAVAGAGEAMLSRLMDKSLLSGSGDGRYDFHELLRQFAAGKLNASAHADAARHRHLQSFVRLAKQGERALRGSPDQLAWSQRLEREHANLQSAVDWGLRQDVPGAAELTAANWLFYFSRGHFHEARQLYDRLLALAERLTVSQKAWLLNARCSVALAQNDRATLQALARQALASFEEAGDKEGMALSHHHLAAAASLYGDSAGVEAHVAAGLHLAQTDWTYYILLQHRASSHYLRGELDEAAAVAEEIVGRAEQAGDRWSLLWFKTELVAKIELERGNAAAVVSLLEQGLEEAQLFHDLQVAAQCSWTLGKLAMAAGNPELAIGRMQEALELLRSAGAAQGNLQLLAELAAAHLAAGQLRSARRILRKAAGLAVDGERLPEMANLLEQLARLVWLESRDLLAVSCLAAAATVREQTKYVPDVYTYEMIKALEQRLRSELPPAVFAARWQAGLEDDPAQLLAQALAPELAATPDRTHPHSS